MSRKQVDYDRVQKLLDILEMAAKHGTQFSHISASAVKELRALEAEIKVEDDEDAKVLAAKRAADDAARLAKEKAAMLKAEADAKAATDKATIDAAAKARVAERQPSPGAYPSGAGLRTPDDVAAANADSRGD